VFNKKREPLRTGRKTAKQQQSLRFFGGCVVCIDTISCGGETHHMCKMSGGKTISGVLGYYGSATGIHKKTGHVRKAKQTQPT